MSTADKAQDSPRFYYVEERSMDRVSGQSEDWTTGNSSIVAQRPNITMEKSGAMFFPDEIPWVDRVRFLSTQDRLSIVNIPMLYTLFSRREFIV